ncbi:hypothetical protein NEMBOFW57_000233 [Staphylotrichum longicolle]|uniref:Uncharacterized protein n=1 Tax=Staphylotrichum longicolle TaxID=669026 RepID=A0AAD4I1G2_9PEZI|nr:hypothetical protein NEMBOFW57_000233 [Staphylotrichum longicolle]
MAIFVNYEGPKLATEQKQAVRSQVMVLVRGRQKQAKKYDAEDVQARVTSRRPHPRAPTITAARNTRGSGKKQLVARQQQQQQKKRHRHPNAAPLNPYDALLVAGHQKVARCGSYSCYLDEAFVLVGFRQPSYFRPDMSKAACIYIGWLLTAGILDSVRGAGDEVVAYPYVEYLAVRELQRFVDGAGVKELHEVVYPVVILGMFEMFRFSPRAITHLAAVEMFIKSRGGLHTMPEVMQNLVVMTDTLECLCLDTPLAFGDLGPCPIMRLVTADGFLSGDQLRSCPLVLCDDENFSCAAQYADPAIHLQLVAVLQAANNFFRQFFELEAQSVLGDDGLAASVADLILDAIMDTPTAGNDVPGLLLETCALAARIMRRTLAGSVDGFDDPENALDVLMIYDNTRFVGLKAWKGLPYVYVWVNLIGFAAATDLRMRSYFIVEVVRCAFSYGCYQMEVFQAVLKNFLHLRNAIVCRRMTLTYAAADTMGGF